MLYALITKDKPDHLDVRLANRDKHLEYLNQTGVVQLAGPFVDEDGTMSGSMIVLDVPDLAAARAWADNDPYQLAGLFETVKIRAWKRVIG